MSDVLVDNIIGESLKLNAQGSKDTCNINLFRGNLQISVWGEDRKRKFSKTLNLQKIEIFKELIHKAMSAPPGKSIGAQFPQWDNEARKPKPDWALRVAKDESNVYFLDVVYSNNGNSEQYRFLLTTPKLISWGEETNDSDRSMMQLKTLNTWLKEYVPITSVLTKRKYNPNAGKGGGGGYNNNNNGGGQAQQSSSNNSEFGGSLY